MRTTAFARTAAVLAIGMLLPFAGCKKEEAATSGGNKPGPSTQPAATQPSGGAESSGGKTAVATLTAAKAAATQPANQNVGGTVTFTPAADGVHVVADLTGLAPGKHGFHLHEKTDMSDPGLMSVGSHWDPDMTKMHGAPDGDHAKHHAGDFGNVEADASGKAHLDETIKGLTVGDGGKYDVIGHAVVVHAKEDDLKEMKSAGPRVAAGAIELKK
jgi:Cu-Zn family superoxide dismutase